MRYAEQVTFTNPLGEGTIGQGIQEFVERHPLARQALPFVRTPTNLLRETFYHMPGVGLLGRRYRAQWFSSPSARATMIGRQMVGTAVLGSAFALAANGRITGAAPTDPALKQAWLEQHPAYSVKVGNTWFPYDRLDPLGMVLGLSADWMTIAAEVTPADADEFGSAFALAIMDRLWGDSPVDTAENIAATIGQAIMSSARTVENKSYFQSLADIIDTIESGDENTWQRFIRNRAGSFIPNALRQANQDQYFREVRSVLDAAMSRVPGLSSRLEPKFDALGRPTMRPGNPIARTLAPVLPIAQGDDPIFREMNRLGQGFLPVLSKKGEVDLSAFKGKDGKSAYYRLNERIAASPLQTQLLKLIQSPGYGKLSDNVMEGLDEVLHSGSKTAAIRKYLNAYRDNSFARLLREQGKELRSKSGLSLLEAYQNDQRNRGLAKLPDQAMLPTR